jgi:fibro-slime domain-containing protein
LSHRAFTALALVFTALPLSLLTACSAAGDGSSKTHGSGTGNGNGNESLGDPGNVSNPDEPALKDDDLVNQMEMPETCGQVLPTIYRDFKGYGEPGGHDDFETSARGVYGPDGMLYKGWNDVGCGLVEPALGSDGKPVAFTGPADVAQGGPTIKAGVGRQQRVVSGAGCWPSTTGVCNVGTCKAWTFDPPTFAIESAHSFDDWYHTTAMNMEIPGELPLVETTPGSGVSVYDSNAFFPIDNQGFGNTPNQQHNYHFTTEIHVKFQYEAGQKFTFRGDDDLWIFVNGKLALDVGGLHEDLEGTIDFDAQAATLGIQAGGSYQMDIFHAERQTSESNFRIETNIRCFEKVTVK